MTEAIMAESRHSAKRLRCAIYTRKSSEEGLEQAFNSLHAQREACAAFILSQKHEGWTVSPTLYDDGGFSGGTMDRPALQRLLGDIAEGTVDVVVVYKIDRLTRSLFNFAKIVEAFEAKGVSFVSITQQFNTSTSMGRLTLNVLLSFPQFERELAGERIRDKIAAFKKKGMWMGGLPPLGYDVKDRKLVVIEEEARTVLHIFGRYLELKSVRALKAATRYRYYVSRSLITGAVKDHSKGRRIPAGNLESLVINRLRAFFADQGAILDAVSNEHPDGTNQKRLISRGRQIAEELPTMASDRIRVMLMALVARVDLKSDCVEIKMRLRSLVELLRMQATRSITQGGKSEKDSGDILTLKVKARLQRVGREMRMLVENAEDQTLVDPGLLRIIARAHDIQARLMQSTDLPLHAIASQERVSPGYISRLLRLPSLAPDIVTAIVNGKNQPKLTAKKLMRLALQIPIDWTEQRKLLGFHHQ
jgi:DNA invertase Pin-like site-specific DNA recombinase